MKGYETEGIRNVALVGHNGSGKTTLTEALLFTSGAIDRQGRVDEGNSTCDFDQEEIRRKMSLHLATAPCEWENCKINFVDVPGYADFAAEVAGATRAVDGAIFVASAQSAGVDVGFETAWTYALREGIARAVFVNKMDKENADYFRLVDALRKRYGKCIAAAEIPIGNAATFHGVVDLIHRKAYTFADGEKIEHPEGIPDDLAATVDEYREQLVEFAAENDDELIEKYLEGKELTNEEIERGLHEGMAAGQVVPILCGSALKDIGVRVLLDLITSEFPLPSEHCERKGVHPQTGAQEVRACKSDAPFSGQVFKTLSDPYVGKLTYFRVLSGVLRPDVAILNSRSGKEERIGPLFFLRGKQQIPTKEVKAGDIAVLSKLAETRTSDTLCDKAKPIAYPAIDFPKPVFTLAISAKSKIDEDKLGGALHRLEEESPSFDLRRDPQTNQTLLTGVGETHIEVLVERLKRFGAQVETAEPKVPFLETITATAKAEGKHKKQTGGRGQFGDCWITLDPLPRGGGFEFVDAIVGGSIPRQYIPAVEKGICEAMTRGIITGNTVVDVRATVYDGKYHDVDSSEAAFKIAGSLAFQNAATLARPALLEPIMNVEVIVPEEYMGDVIGDLNSRRGKVLGMDRIEPADGVEARQCVKAVVPQSELMRYAIDLRSITHGRGNFIAEGSHYEEAPAHITQEVIDEAKQRGFNIHAEH